MGVNVTERLWQLLRDLGFVDDKVSGDRVLTQAHNATQTVKNSSITLFALDALGGAIKDIRVEFWLAADNLATFTPSFFVTREGAPVVFVEVLLPVVTTIGTPGAPGRYRYEYQDLPEGAQLEFRVAQDNLGNANNDIEGVLTYLG